MLILSSFAKSPEVLESGREVHLNKVTFKENTDISFFLNVKLKRRENRATPRVHPGALIERRKDCGQTLNNSCYQKAGMKGGHHYEVVAHGKEDDLF